MRSLSKTTTDADSLRGQIRDNSVRIIDVRRAEDYKKDHIPKSVNLPLAELLADDSPEKVLKIAQNLGIDDQTQVVVYDDTFGALASRVAWTLQYLGHSEVSLLDMTYSQWKGLGLETDNSETEISSKTHSIKLQPQIMSSAEYLEQVKEQKNVIVIDNRERLNFLEQHIPGAINIPYRTLASDDKILKPKEEMKRLLKNRNIPQDAEIITYCGSVGTLSGLAYYALKSADFPNVKLYVRSFKEWKGLNKPIVRQENANYWDLSAE
ncbi:MAG TPA: sulfurtransferase [Candidatus Nitrosotenuis sp.]|jgi:thiosulfate/3-mercaptopyruvate sulfurtransferase|nr:sulfurtransferase [Candidatus Nitrosotenuis sp.]HIH46202.1 sulfurtransferase [Candidatus Nitrosotenuis sp.]HIH68361.1 sulfurtransferase [Candidatus Nitrosotenuis sp.]HII03164.1 sulfurtransferase [Candidatus Nitrosotenuis sp.]